MLARILFKTGSSFTRVMGLNQQRRYGGSLTKNKHIENYNNWRGDSEKRFKFDKEFFTSMTAWCVIPFTLYYVLQMSERRKIHRIEGLSEEEINKRYA